MIRGSRAAVIVPKVLLLFRPFEPATKAVLGARKFAWLMALNASIRNCRLSRSRILVTLFVEKSILMLPGPRTSGNVGLRLPKVHAGGLTNAFVLNHASIVGLSSF